MVNEVKIPEKVRNILMDIDREIRNLQNRYLLICQTVLFCNDVDGDFFVNQDMTYLIRRQQPPNLENMEEVGNEQPEGKDPSV